MRNLLRILKTQGKELLLIAEGHANRAIAKKAIHKPQNNGGPSVEYPEVTKTLQHCGTDQYAIKKGLVDLKFFEWKLTGRVEAGFTYGLPSLFAHLQNLPTTNPSVLKWMISSGKRSLYSQQPFSI